MPKKKKALTVLSRNSYKGRLKGVLPAFLPDRCPDLTIGEKLMIEELRFKLSHLLTEMEKK